MLVTNDDSTVTYQASSPDEVAIVTWTASVGLTLVFRDRTKMELQTPTGARLTYDILEIFPFTSESKRMGIIIAIAWFSQWSGNGLVSYYLTIILDNIGITSSAIKLLINGILQIWNFFWACLASFMVERLGRRLLFITSAAGMTVFFTLQTACSAVYAETGNQHAAHAVLAFIFLFYAAYE